MRWVRPNLSGGNADIVIPMKVGIQESLTAITLNEAGLPNSGFPLLRE